MKYLNRKEADEKTDGILEGIGWEYDYGGNRDANKIKSHISSLRTRDLDSLIEHCEVERKICEGNSELKEVPRGQIYWKGMADAFSSTISYLNSLKEKNK